MTNLTIEIPDHLARCLESIAAAQSKSVAQVAQESLNSLLGSAGSPDAVLRAARAAPSLSSAAMDDLDAAIAAGRLPIRDENAFER